VPNCCPCGPKLSVQFVIKWYSPAWIVLPRTRAASTRVLLKGRVIVCLGLVVRTPVLAVVPVTGNGLLSGKVAVASGDVPSGWTGPTMVWLTACDPTGQGPELTDCMGVVSVPDVGVIVRVPSEPGGTLAPATPFASNTDPAVTAATTAPDTRRVNIFFLCTM
jgi:hypothetical protein